jgi:hypothetical protein
MSSIIAKLHYCKNRVNTEIKQFQINLII